MNVQQLMSSIKVKSQEVSRKTDIQQDEEEEDQEDDGSVEVFYSQEKVEMDLGLTEFQSQLFNTFSMKDVTESF